MYIHEELALQIVKERNAEAIRIAEQARALGPSDARTSARVRFGRSLVRLGHWISGQPSPAWS